MGRLPARERGSDRRSDLPLGFRLVGERRLVEARLHSRRAVRQHRRDELGGEPVRRDPQRLRLVGERRVDRLRSRRWRVSIDPATGRLSGYAWSESLGRISFRGAGAVESGVGEQTGDPATSMAIPAMSGAGPTAPIAALGAAGIWLVRARAA